jgi:hypothetical protein
MYDDKSWSAPYRPIPRTEQDFLNLRECARKKSIEIAVRKYLNGLEGAKNARLYGDYPKKRISNQQYQALVTLSKTELGKTLSGLLRKGDRIEIPRE